MAKKSLVTYKNKDCLNCGFPFTGQEIFCPECGQKDKDSKLSFTNFIKEVFGGFFSWDAKFWKTIIPLLIKPGKVSRDYIEGKRIRYSNPFRFYLTVSIIFFLILSLSKSIDKISALKTGKTHSKNILAQKNKKAKDIDIDSLKTAINEELKNSWIPTDSLERKEIIEKVEKKINEAKKDSTKTINLSGTQISFEGSSTIDKTFQLIKKYPNLPIDNALDSLQLEKTFTNRFLYDRATKIESFTNSTENQELFVSQLLSYASIALFIFLPLFTLLLKLIYFSKKHRYSYVEHLIFVFHTQTVFFMLLCIYFLFEIFNITPNILVFMLIFLVYLFIAMLTFYRQSKLKTFIKFCLINIGYFTLAMIGVVIVLLISFALY